ncbi:hypothetical protein FRC18_011280, partial [Serendipita sp. 400]
MAMYAVYSNKPKGSALAASRLSSSLDPTMNTTIDDTHASYSTSPSWSTWVWPAQNPQPLFGTTHGTTNAGAIASFTFTGTAIYVYGYKGSDHGYRDFSIDGQTPIRCDGRVGIQGSRVVLYWADGLTQGAHNITVKNTGAQGEWLNLDYFIVTSEGDATSSGGSSSASSTSTSASNSEPPTSTGGSSSNYSTTTGGPSPDSPNSSNNSNRKESKMTAIILGSVLGMALVALVLLLLWLLRRHMSKRNASQLNASKRNSSQPDEESGSGASIGNTSNANSPQLDEEGGSGPGPKRRNQKGRRGRGQTRNGQGAETRSEWWWSRRLFGQYTDEVEGDDELESEKAQAAYPIPPGA